MKIFKYQQWHFLTLMVLLFVLYFIAKTDATFLSGELNGIPTLYWCILAFLSPIVHQLYVLICWRSELYYKGLSKLFGENGFKLFKIGFAILMLSRLITIILLAISNAYTLNIDKVFSYFISGVLLIPLLYLFYSIRKYFGFDRAIGIDHFYPDQFKSAQMVNQGIVRIWHVASLDSRNFIAIKSCFINGTI